MKFETKEELMDTLMGEEVNFRRVDGALSSIHERYELSNAVLTNMILYSHLLAFSFYEAEEAVTLVAELVENYSSFELSEMAKSVLGSEVVDFYKDTVFQDYAITQGPMARALEQALEETGGSFEVLEEMFDNIGEKLEDKQ